MSMLSLSSGDYGATEGGLPRTGHVSVLGVKSTHTRDSNTSENWTRTLRRKLLNPQHTGTHQLSMRSRTTDVRAHSVRTPDAREYGDIIDDGAPTTNSQRSLAQRQASMPWPNLSEKQGIPENTSHGEPLEDSRCRTERSKIQTSSETRSKPPPHTHESRDRVTVEPTELHTKPGSVP